MTAVRSARLVAAAVFVMLSACHPAHVPGSRSASTVAVGAPPDGIATPAAAVDVAPPPSARFFVAGDGTLVLVDARTHERTAARYRRGDGSYDAAALAILRRALRSRDGAEGPLVLRLVETLAAVQGRAGGRDLVLVSGYRSPGYNDDIRRRGAKAAGASLHSEGLAADVAVPGVDLAALWRALRAEGCCGVGFYAENGFLHVDVGRPRFWEATTSRVDENLSAGNARLFARTEFDRYAAGEPIVVTVHALTVPPLAVARVARFVPDRGPAVALAVRRIVPDGAAATSASPADPGWDAPSGAPPPSCFIVDRTGAALVLDGLPSVGAGYLELAICPPRADRTPASIATNPLAIR